MVAKVGPELTSLNVQTVVNYLKRANMKMFITKSMSQHFLILGEQNAFHGLHICRAHRPACTCRHICPCLESLAWTEKQTLSFKGYNNHIWLFTIITRKEIDLNIVEWRHQQGKFSFLLWDFRINSALCLASLASPKWKSLSSGSTVLPGRNFISLLGLLSQRSGPDMWFGANSQRSGPLISEYLLGRLC